MALSGGDGLGPLRVAGHYELGLLTEPGRLSGAQDHVHTAAVIGAQPQLAAAEVLVASDYHSALPGAPLGDLVV
jgi:hypothetical protein